MKSIDKSQIDVVTNLAGLDENSKINLKLFHGLAALSERVFFDFFV